MLQLLQYKFSKKHKGGIVLKLISWNIDSLNAALTSESARALLSKEVLNTIIEYDPEVIALQETKLSSNGPTKKHLEILEEKFLIMKLFGIVQWNQPVRVMQVPCFYIKRI